MTERRVNPDAYYEGIRDWPEWRCPYSRADGFRYHWYHAGFHDARRGLAG